MLLPGSSLFWYKERSSASFQSLLQWLHGDSKQQAPKASNNTAPSFSGSDAQGAAEMMLWQCLIEEKMPPLESQDPEIQYSKGVSFLTAPALLSLTVWLSWIREGPSFVCPSHTGKGKPSCASALRFFCEWEMGKKWEEEELLRRPTLCGSELPKCWARSRIGGKGRRLVGKVILSLSMTSYHIPYLSLKLCSGFTMHHVERGY